MMELLFHSRLCILTLIPTTQVDPFNDLAHTFYDLRKHWKNRFFASICFKVQNFWPQIMLENYIMVTDAQTQSQNSLPPPLS